jgi:hypothetical protein
MDNITIIIPSGQLICREKQDESGMINTGRQGKITRIYQSMEVYRDTWNRKENKDIRLMVEKKRNRLQNEGCGRNNSIWLTKKQF